ncbi:MAG: TPM domain-containing protein [Methylobacter sp.]|uniref:TPM domain-containing protein n=1 Tax=Methylobacter sp. TaxID=2051955 RepID=UPI002730C5F9|nr:TPM domain-containing protein [Methylobacter sp.]MDP1665927.1 TPM domain-containing protein [Methylobacter sp.]MDP1970259.1 TPM domain-containing protein [Methylobacter sp.]
MVNIKRWFRHAFMLPWRWRVLFPKAVLGDIEKAVKYSEHQHSGELRFAIENVLALSQVWRGISARQRAIEVFSDLRVWDTEQNSGVLIYLLLADREVHIVADRGIAKCVEQVEWDAIAQDMQQEFLRGDFLRGSLQGIERITMLLATHFPPGADNPNELSNKPVIV